MNQVGEITIRGSLALREDDPNALATVAHSNEVEGWRGVTFRVITAESVLAQITAARARCDRALLVEVDCRGGTCGVAWAIHDALREFSAAGGRVVSFVEKAGSGGVDIAMAGDFVVAWQPPPHRRSWGTRAGLPGFLMHAALANPALTAEENDRMRREVRAQNMRRIAPRVATRPAELEAWLSLTETPDTFVAAWLSPDAAMAHGWVDMIGDRDLALAVAHSMARGEHVETLRSAMLGSLVVHAEVGRDAFPRPPAVRVKMPALPGLHFGGKSAAEAECKLADIASDNVLSAGEKPSVIQNYNVLMAEQTGIDAQATAYGITTEKTAYDSAVSALTTYLATLTSPTAWNDTSGDTTIVGTTFRSKFEDVYTTRQTLLNAISARSVQHFDAVTLISWQSHWADSGGTTLVKFGDIVILNLSAVATALAGSVACVLPTGYRPASGTYPVAAAVTTGGTFVRANVTASGQVGIGGTISATQYDVTLTFRAA